MKIQLSLAGASPLSELHIPKTNELKHLAHEVNDIVEIRKGHVRAIVKYDIAETGKDHWSAHVELSSEVGTGSIKFIKDGTSWRYEAETSINALKTEYKGNTHHHSVQAIVRKVRALAKLL